MDTTLTMLIREVTEQQVRAKQAEDRLTDLEHLLGGLGVTFWHTDRELSLTGSFGMVIAEAFHDRYIGDFYREAYGLDDDDSLPLQAHREARDGEQVTLALEYKDCRYAIMIGPRFGACDGAVVGTMGMALKLGEGK